VNTKISWLEEFIHEGAVRKNIVIYANVIDGKEMASLSTALNKRKSHCI